MAAAENGDLQSSAEIAGRLSLNAGGKVSTNRAAGKAGQRKRRPERQLDNGERRRARGYWTAAKRVG